MKTTKIVIWVLAVLITVGSSVYQRRTGPTHSVRMEVLTSDGEKSFSLKRSGTTGKDTKIEIPIKNSEVGEGEAEAEAEAEAVLFYKHYPVIEGSSFISAKMKKEGDMWVAYLPSLPEAAKWVYYAEAEGNTYGSSDNGIIIRYKGDVPAAILIPHIIFMFASMLLIVVAAGFAVRRIITYRKYLYLSLISLLLGGFVFGPLVQHYAFGPFWTGFPMGMDLTDNKTLIALIALMIAWGIETFMPPKVWKSWVCVGAAVVMMGIFSIPHSMGGSERDPQSGELSTASVKSEINVINERVD